MRERGCRSFVLARPARAEQFSFSALGDSNTGGVVRLWPDSSARGNGIMPTAVRAGEPPLLSACLTRSSHSPRYLRRSDRGSATPDRLLALLDGQLVRPHHMILMRFSTFFALRAKHRRPRRLPSGSRRHRQRRAVAEHRVEPLGGSIAASPQSAAGCSSPSQSPDSSPPPARTAPPRNPAASCNRRMHLPDPTLCAPCCATRRNIASSTPTTLHRIFRGHEIDRIGPPHSVAHASPPPSSAPRPSRRSLAGSVDRQTP